MYKLLLPLLFFFQVVAAQDSVRIIGTGLSPKMPVLAVSLITNGEAELWQKIVPENGNFVWADTISKLPAMIMFHDQDYTDYGFMWLEKGVPLRISGKGKGRIAEAILQGGPLQSDQNMLNAALKGVKKEEEEVRRIKAFILANPNSYVALQQLKTYASSWGLEVARPYWDALSAELKALPESQRLRKLLEKTRKLKLGDQAPDFQLPGTDGKMVNLTDFKGKVTLLRFWGSWCGPCRENNPLIAKLHKQYTAKGFDVIGIASDTDRAEWLKAIKQDGIYWTNASELKGADSEVMYQYGISSYPTNVLLDREGKIIAWKIDTEELTKKLKELYP